MECGSDPTKREGERTDCSHTVVASGGGREGAWSTMMLCVCVYGYRSQWYMAVGCSFTDISGLACYNYLLVVTVFSAPPFPDGVAAPGEEE